MSAARRLPALAFLGFLGGSLVGCGSGGLQPAHGGELTAEATPVVSVATPLAAPLAAAVASAPLAETPAPAEGDQATESAEERSDFADEPEEGQGQLRDLGQKPARGGPCQLQVGPLDPSLDPVVRDWIGTRETGAARDAAALCGSALQLGPVAAGFACRALLRRKNVLIVACYTFPNIMGNANPSRAHAVFDLTGGRPKLLGVGDIFVRKSAACVVVGAALAARESQLHDRSPAEWSARCRASPNSPVADGTLSVRGSRLTFDISGEFLPWGNAPDALEIPIEDLRKVLTPRFAALLER